jgi:hypothetical protein
LCAQVAEATKLQRQLAEAQAALVEARGQATERQAQLRSAQQETEHAAGRWAFYEAGARHSPQCPPPGPRAGVGTDAVARGMRPYARCFMCRCAELEQAAVQAEEAVQAAESEAAAANAAGRAQAGAAAAAMVQGLRDK